MLHLKFNNWVRKSLTTYLFNGSIKPNISAGTMSGGLNRKYGSNSNVSIKAYVNCELCSSNTTVVWGTEAKIR